MKAYKSIRQKDAQKIEVEVAEALRMVKIYNKEFCHDKSDDELIREMQIAPIHTNLRKYWIENLCQRCHKKVSTECNCAPGKRR